MARSDPAGAIARHPDPDPPRPAGIGGAVPRGWAVLAVVLALMALVAAVSAGPRDRVLVARRAPRTTADRVPSPGGSRPRSVTTRGRGRTGAAVPAGARAAVGRARVSASPTDLPSAPGAVTEGLPIVASASAGSSGQPAATGPAASAPPTTPTAATTASAAGTPPAQPPATGTAQTDPGYLQYPDDVSARYQYPEGPSGLTAAVTWAGSSTLSLSVTCPGGQQSRTGPSGLQVDVAAGAGECTVTLAEPQPVAGAVSYSLTIGPGAG